ncbi:MAG: sulfatase [Bacteroidales bacterium]|nr:sulfatase [Bacteroidales bacterium]
MSDDHASGAISAYGNSLLETPNIDKLADQGMRFNNCFNIVSLCGPSKAAILSGKYSIHNGYMRNGDSFERNQTTFPKLLQQAGYETAIIGKWHLVTQPAGFDYYNVIPFQGKFFDCPMKETGQKWQDRDKGGIIQPGYLTEVITDKAIDWLKNRDKKRPFYLLVHHKAPHEPYHYPERYEELLEDKTIAEPDNFNDSFDGRNHVLANNECRYSKFSYISMPFLKDILPQDMENGTADYKTVSYPIVMKGYHRLVAALDENIGRLMDFVDNSELEKNTIVVYTSDNGWFLGDHGLFNKMWMYEESLHVPLIIRYPGKIKPATMSDDFVSVLDFAPTFLDYAGIKKPVQFQGQSIKPVLSGNTPDDWKSAHFYHYFGQFEVPSHYGIRTNDYKLIYFYEAEQEPKWELYDMKNDPKEMVNLIHNPEYTDIFKNLEILLLAKRKEFEESRICNI